MSKYNFKICIECQEKSGYCDGTCPYLKEKKKREGYISANEM